MPDFGETWKTKAVTKGTIVKAYGGGTTYSTTYVDVGSMTISVPNGWYYIVQYGYLSSYAVSCHVRVLEGATVKQEIAFSQANPILYANNHAFKNTSGSTQTVKIQLKCDGGDGVTQYAILYYASGGASQYPPIQILPIPATANSSGSTATNVPNVRLPLYAYVTSLDFAVVAGQSAGVDYFTVNGMPYEGGDTTSTITTISPNTFYENIEIIGTNASVNPTWLIYDYSGVKLTL